MRGFFLLWLLFQTSFQQNPPLEHMIVNNLSSEGIPVTTGWTNRQLFRCNTTPRDIHRVRANMDFSGFYTSNTFTFTGSPAAHWRLNYRLDFSILQIQGQITVRLLVNNVQVDQFSFQPSPMTQNICGNTNASVVSLSRMVNSNVRIQSIQFTASSNSQFAIHDFQIFTNICVGCFSCTNGGVCLASFAAFQNTEPYCEDGYFYDGSSCVYNNCHNSVCLQCNIGNECLFCQPGFFLSSGKCVEQCPQFTQRVGSYCSRTNSISAAFAATPSSANLIRLQVLSFPFSDQEAIRQDYQIIGLAQSPYIINSRTSVYNGLSFLGGQFITGLNQQIRVTFRNVQRHARISQFLVTVVLIDDWSATGRFQININQLSWSLIPPAFTSPTAGFSQNDRNTQYQLNDIALNLSQYDITFRALSIPAQSAWYAIRDVQLILDRCPQNCQTCTDTTCTLCMANHFFWNGQCVASCPIGTFLQSNQCISCYQGCLSCNGRNNNNCLSCRDRQFLHDGRCQASCPPGLSPGTNQNCIQCGAGCASCNQTAPNTCLRCNPPLSLHQGVCLQNCPINWFSQNNVCVQCHQFCSRCFGGVSTQCTECRSGNFLQPTPNVNTCLPSCPARFFRNTATHVCSPCISNCSTCTNATNCSACIGGYHLLNGRCVSTCPDGSFSQNQQCVPCHTSCLTCLGGGTANHCSSCPSGLLLHNNQCVITCPDGWFELNRQCSRCDSRCASCNGSSTQCTRCNSPYVRHQESNECSNECPDGHYYDEKRDCNSCQPNCNTCTDSNSCLICSENFVLIENQCVQNCPDGYYSESGSCLRCHENCASCESGASYDCDKCNPGFVFIPHLRECTKQCRSGQFLENGNCLLCHESCASCINGEETGCDSCDKGSFLNPDNTCSPTCPDGYFTDIKNEKCSKCRPECETCLYLDYCTSCNEGFNKYYNTCVEECPLGTIKGENQDCIYCDPICETCQDRIDNCVTCFNDYFIHNSTCVDECPPGYQKGNDQKCQKCGSNCETCSPDQADECLTCSGIYYLLNGKCVENCGDGYYQYSNKCLPCDPSCRECFGSTNNECDNCSEGYFLQPESNKCLSTCPPLFSPNPNTNTCTECSIRCQTCTDESTCTECQGKYLLVDGMCISSCPPNSSDQSCEPCHSDCKECYGGSQDNCTECQEGRYLYRGECLSDCPEGTVGYDNHCVECKYRCSSCSGTVDHCSSCNSPYILNQSTNSCEESCPLYFFPDENRVCTQCVEGCQVCTGPEQCSQCSDHLYLHNNKECLSACPEGFVAYNGVCEKCPEECPSCKSVGYEIRCLECSEGYYLNAEEGSCVQECPSEYVGVNGQCERCHQSCYKCSTTQSDGCTTCQNGLYLNPDNTCKPTCPEGNFPYSNGRLCKNCHPNCATCRGSTYRECYTCNEGYQLLNGTTICSPPCPDGQFLNQETNVCEPCSSQCATCSDKNFCTSCKGDYRVSNGTCVSSCPPGQYPNEVECRQCHENCIECYAGENDNCTACPDGLKLFESQCVEQCPEGTLAVDNICQSCNYPCAACERDIYTCTSCRSPYLFMPSTSQCLEWCPPSYFGNENRTCEQCQVGCLQCTQASICLLCNQHHVNQSGRCQPSCDPGYQNLNRVCVTCPSECASCSSLQGQIFCTECSDGYFLHTGTSQCFSVCPQGMVGDESTKTCLPCHSTCLYCSNTMHNGCTKCRDGLILNPNNTCLITCPPNFGNFEGICKRCSDNCSSCEGDVCTRCSGSSALYNQICIDECPDGTYLDDFVINECLSCHRTCQTCSDSSQFDCLSCHDGSRPLANGRCQA